MSVSSVQSFNVNNAYQPKFKGKASVKEIDKGDYIEKHIQTEASTGKKWGVGIASAFLSGLGQFINGDVGKGFAFLGASIATGVAAGLSFAKGSKAGYLGSLIAGLGVEIWTIVDAVKNAKSESVQIVQKDKE